MSIVIQATTGAGINAYLCYENLLRQATVYADSWVSGFNPPYAADWLPYTWWKADTSGTHYLDLTLASAKTANYFAVAYHNLGQGDSTTIQLKYSLDAGATWLDAAPATSGVGLGSKVILQVFNDISAARWRVYTFCGAGLPIVLPALGIVSFGRRVPIPYGIPMGFSPPSYNRDNDITNSESEGGVFLGRSVVRNGSMVDLNLRALTPTWVRTEWEPFIDHAEMHPFFFGWDVVGHPFESALCWAENIEPARYDEPQIMSASFKARAVLK